MSSVSLPARTRVAAVIVSYNTRELTLAAVESVLASEGVRPEVWVVDNASHDGSAEAVGRRWPGEEVHVVELPENVGFGRANNAALERTEAPYVLLLNSDARLEDPTSLAALVTAMQARERCGVLGPRLRSPEGRLQHSAKAFPSMRAELLRRGGLHALLSPGTRARLLAGEFWDYGRAGEPDWLAGACLLVRREVLRTVGLFDPAIFLYGEELEWFWRVRRAGWRVSYEPSVTVSHVHGASGDFEPAWKVRMAMAGDAYAVRKHRGRAYLAAFAVARGAGLAADVLVQGAGSLASGGARRRRARASAGALAGWIGALRRGGATSPGGPALRPAATAGGAR